MCAKSSKKAEVKFEELAPVLSEYADVPGSLITILQKAQSIYGYLSLDTINYISERTGIPTAKIYGVATFYAQFRLQPIGKYLIMMCQGTACHVNGSESIGEAVSEHLGIKNGETTKDGLFTLNYVACLGCCSLAPVMMIETAEGSETYGSLTKDKAVKILDEIAARK
ncbi:MAG: NADH-quinone oxidoreductase subunit NuoE [Firmicutes bacterium]|nr:NADH-quinone oxidoreductase subunit NuoE [Bacillota bacterium]